MELLCCVPVDRPAPAGWTVPGLDVAHGLLPGGREPVGRRRHDDVPRGVAGALHPAVVAVLVEADHRGADVRLDRLRQVVLADGEGVEVAVPLAAAG